jgi:hypothetical protein
MSRIAKGLRTRLLFTLALALIAKDDGRSANLLVVGGLSVIIRES